MKIFLKVISLVLFLVSLKSFAEGEDTLLKPEPIEAKGVYSAVIPIRVERGAARDTTMSDYESFASDYLDRYEKKLPISYDTFVRLSGGTLAVSIGHTAFNFKAHVPLNIRDSFDRRPALPQILKDAKATVTMEIAEISPNLSKFWINITTSSGYLENTLSDDSKTIVARYLAEVSACDGQDMEFSAKSNDIRDRIEDLAGINFLEYLGCKLQLTFVSSDKDFSTDPYGLRARHQIHGDPYARASGEFIKNFDLNIGAHGNATLAGYSTLAFLDYSRKSDNSRIFDQQEIKFTLKTALSKYKTPDSNETLRLANEIADAIISYADLSAAGLSPNATASERSMIDDAAFAEYSQKLAKDLKDMRASFAEMAIQDQFLALSIVGRAYKYSDKIKIRTLIPKRDPSFYPKPELLSIGPNVNSVREQAFRLANDIATSLLCYNIDKEHLWSLKDKQPAHFIHEAYGQLMLRYTPTLAAQFQALDSIDEKLTESDQDLIGSLVIRYFLDKQLFVKTMQELGESVESLMGRPGFNPEWLKKQ